MGYIYKVTNTANGKVYIGQTRRTIEIRWKEHIRDSYKPNLSYLSILHCAIRKYSEELFIVEQVEECSNELLDVREKYWIKYYGSCNKGYNISYGGGGWLKEDDSKLLGLWAQGLSVGEIADMLPLCGDTISRRLKLNNISEEEIIARGCSYKANKMKKQIYQYDLDGYYIREFETIKEAMESIGGKHIAINSNDPYITSGGYQWRRYKVDKIAPISDRPIKRTQTKCVHQYTLDGYYIKSYKSVKEAAEAIGCEPKSKSTIRCACNGENQTAYGYRWSYNKVECLPPLHKKDRRKVAKLSKDREVIQIYDSITDASKENNIGIPDIVNVCKGNHKTAGGYYWEYLEAG